MASLISDSDKITLESIMLDVFDTFKRPISVYSAPEKLYVSTDPNFSRFGQFGQNNEFEQEDINQQNVQTIYAVILYSKNPAFEQFNKDQTGGSYEPLKIKDSQIQVRIRVDSIGNEIMKGAKLINLDGRDFRPDSPSRGHGLFTTTRWDYYFKENL